MKRRKNSNRIILLVIALLVLLLIIIFAILSNMKNSAEINSNKNLGNVNISVQDQNIDIQANKTELERIKSMNERTRIEYYVANYIEMLENGEYDKAYSLLNKDYKKNYFKTQSDFEEYCKKTFSKMLSVEYTNFERNGDIYVVWITMTDAINGTKNSGKEMNFVVKENTFNDYELSFSVI